MAVKDITKVAFTDAMRKFDSHLRGYHEWANWETNKAHKYAISTGSLLYPVKQIVSMASGVVRSQFVGGVAPSNANSIAINLGFEVIALRTSSLRNPTWSRDELILALDTYVRFGGNPPSKASYEIASLSRILNKVQKILGGQGTETLRNPSGVYMKLMNFRRFDPTYLATGRVGLERGGKLEEVVWADFHTDPDHLAQIAIAIRKAISREDELPSSSPTHGFEDDEFEASEGRILTVQHQRRERSSAIVRRKKDQELNRTGRLACAVCEFDFSLVYGERGAGFIECHHTKPVETLEDGEKTRLSDLALLCSNCHRMIHARRPWLTISELQEIRV